MTNDQPDHTYIVNEIVGSSPEGVDQAIRNGLARASKTLRHLDWFEVREIRGTIADGDVGWFQVRMGVGLRAEEPS
ncbi:MAG: dodecin family protein [Chloroflexi bacterium]|nr:dodecin family protein [Chloroflexota bacterium]